MVFDPASAKNKALIASAIFDKSHEIKPLVPLSLQAPLAFVLLLLCAISFGFYFNSTEFKKSLVYAGATSVTLAFGAIFLADAVHAYTG